MSTDQTPAMARATEEVRAQTSTGFLPAVVARAAVSAALHAPDGALVEAVVPTLDNYWCGDHYDYQVTDDDGEPLQCCAKARLEQARRMFDAVRAAILGATP